jgi:hypothetical protein
MREILGEDLRKLGVNLLTATTVTSTLNPQSITAWAVIITAIAGVVFLAVGTVWCYNDTIDSDKEQ